MACLGEKYVDSNLSVKTSDSLQFRLERVDKARVVEMVEVGTRCLDSSVDFITVSDWHENSFGVRHLAFLKTNFL